jgi:hypothetical protein
VFVLPVVVRLRAGTPCDRLGVGENLCQIQEARRIAAFKIANGGWFRRALPRWVRTVLFLGKALLFIQEPVSDLVAIATFFALTGPDLWRGRTPLAR